MNVEQEINQIKYRMDLLFENSPLSRLLYEYNITEEQDRKIQDVLNLLEKRMEDGEEVTSSEYESMVCEICADNPNVEYHFCEKYARECWLEGRWKDTIKNLYSWNRRFDELWISE